MLTAKFINSYQSKTGKITARYRVSGSAEELESYKASKGTWLRFDDDGVTPIIFGDCPLDEAATYKIKSWGSPVQYSVDFSAITTAAGAINTAEKRGNDRLANEVAKQQASRLMGTTVTPSASSALQAAVSATAEPEPAALDQPIAPSVKKK